MNTIRRFSILDVMAFTAAIAIGVWMLHIIHVDFLPYDPIWIFAQRSWAMMLPITWATAALRSTDPPPRFQAPGVAACLSVTVVSLCLLALVSHNFVGVLMGQGWPPRQVWRFAVHHISTPMPLAATVVATWANLTLDRKWQPEPSWIDRFGRVLGLYWITSGIYVPVSNIMKNWH